MGTHLMINPWSFMCWLSQKEFSSYWVETSYFETVASVLKPRLRHILLPTFLLLSNCTMNRATVPRLVPNINHATATLNNADAILHFLVLTGYLTYEPSEDRLHGAVFIPNMEVRLHWESTVVHMIRSHVFRRYPGLSVDLLNAFEAEPFNLKSLRVVMRKLLLKFCSCWDTIAENYYHCFYLRCFAMAVDDGFNAIVTSNAEAGIERFGMCVECRNLKRVFVIEFKKSDKIETLLDDARSGLKQIVRNEYAAKFDKHCDFVLIGVSFFSMTMSPLVCIRLKNSESDEMVSRQQGQPHVLAEEICLASDVDPESESASVPADTSRLRPRGRTRKKHIRPRKMKKTMKKANKTNDLQ
jgi:hypothetical protein